MGERNWRPATVNALAELLTWYARREVGRIRGAPTVNDHATTPTAEASTAPGRPGVPSPPRST